MRCCNAALQVPNEVTLGFGAVREQRLAVEDPGPGGADEDRVEHEPIELPDMLGEHAGSNDERLHAIGRDASAPERIGGS